MALFEEHCKDCKDELGETFPYVHIWLDEFSETLGTDHRDVRHHNIGVEKVRELWGDREAKAAEIHILKDSKGIIPNIEDISFKIRLAMKPNVEKVFNEEFFKNMAV